MAHYKLGVLLKESEIKENDMMFGLTNKVWGLRYEEIKNEIILALAGLASHIEEYLEL